MSRPDLILLIGGISQLVAIVAAAYEVHVAYSTLQNRAPVWQRLRWRRGRTYGEVFTVKIKGALEVDDSLVSPKGGRPLGRLDAIENRLAEIARRTKAAEKAVSTSATLIGQLGEDVTDLSANLRSTEAKLRGLIDAAQAGNVTVRSLIAVAFLIGVPFATWHEWITEHAFREALGLAGLALLVWFGMWVRRRRRQPAGDG